MRKQFRWAMLAVFSCLVCGLCTQSVGAISPSVVISQVQVGDINSSRLIELYNNSENDIDITGWCVYRSPASNASLTTVGCLTDSDPAVRILFPSKTYVLFAAPLFFVDFDMPLAVTLGNGISGHVYVKDAEKQEIDRVGWGINNPLDSDYPKNAEGTPVGLGTNKIIERRASEESGILIDTDDNVNDFIQSSLRDEYKSGALYDIVDVCLNIAGIQASVPAGYTIDDTGNCTLPVVDICTNLPGVQPSLPADYKLDDDDNCILDLLPLWVTELLPNPEGADDGNEFIELYNPNSSSISLSLYLLKVGIDTPKLYEFPAGSTIGPEGYLTFSKDDIAFTLVNSTSQVSLIGVDGQIIDESPAYSNPGDGMAWALIDGIWQYTNRPTPDLANLASLIDPDDVEEVVTGLKPCAPNQYRNPETNRCRLLVTVGSTLAPCKDGQYRSEETNRCRSIASDVESLIPCGPNQERNPETNRCRLITSGGDVLGACPAGQERNPDTNRCRNITGTMPDAGFAVEPIIGAASDLTSWWALGGISSVAVGYAGWEWREELLLLIRRLSRFFPWHK